MKDSVVELEEDVLKALKMTAGSLSFYLILVWVELAFRQGETPLFLLIAMVLVGVLVIYTVIGMTRVLIKYFNIVGKEIEASEGYYYSEEDFEDHK